MGRTGSDCIRLQYQRIKCPIFSRIRFVIREIVILHSTDGLSEASLQTTQNATTYIPIAHISHNISIHEAQ
ncbi:hypothetical protein SeMB42_g07215 [Synchytrium endobioticum]|uniref:Uncharacterized protein n=1 Tax=Synchytrium endobioticum TaxID=286115 RepID=A0A507CAZ1_9FUNG|nr:hypothetical protein SeMB42_g07215 [Synchytrium endobioticum]